MKMKVKDEEFVHPVEVREVLEKKEEDDMSHEQAIALENLSRHTKIEDKETLEELHSELSEIEDLKDRHIYKLLQVVPQYESTVEAVFSKERVKLDESQVQNILDIMESIQVE
jgi:DNA-directed RNA polymerase subunit F